MKRALITCTLLFVIAALFGSCGRDDEVIRVGITGAFNAHWELISRMVAEEGIVLELVSFSDFFTPNRALDEGDLDLNAFQHKMFLANEIANQGYAIEYIAETFIVPLNIFNNKNRISSIEDLQDGHTIAIPGDPTNRGRSLRLLETAGLIELETPPGENASVLDITVFHVEINILEAESGMLAQILPDVEAAIINGGNAFTAGLNPALDSIFTEEITGDFRNDLTNVIAARSADMVENGERARKFRIIAAAFQSDEVRQFILEEYGGAFIPVW